MQDKIVEAFNESYGCHYEDFEEIKNEYSATEILDTWLRYEGILGYTSHIVDVLAECGVQIEE